MDAELELHTCRGTCFTSLLTVVRLDVGQLIFILSVVMSVPKTSVPFSSAVWRLLTVPIITETIDLLRALFHLAYKQYWKEKRIIFDCQWMLLPLLISSALNSTWCSIWVKLPVLVIPPLFFITLLQSHVTPYTFLQPLHPSSVFFSVS